MTSEWSEALEGEAHRASQGPELGAPVERERVGASSWISRCVLGVAAMIAIAIGLAILVAPVAFHAGYGIEYGNSTSLLSETRAAGGSLFANGLLILLGAFVPRATSAAAVLGAATFLSYGVSRVLGMIVDGMPASGLTFAAVVEIVFGIGCVLVAIRHPPARRNGAQPRAVAM